MEKLGMKYTAESLLQAIDEIVYQSGRFSKDLKRELLARAAELSAQESKPWKDVGGIPLMTDYALGWNACRQAMYEAASVSAQDASPKDGWQPIETAPMDGTEVLVIDAGEVQQVSWWAHAWSHDDSYVPTHWQPLPEPPK
jgi:hypothetical protein